jgi:hypothetical protein
VIEALRRSAWRIAGPIGVVAAFAFAPALAQAATYTVGNPNDTPPGTPCQSFPTGCSLRQLIEHENTAGTNDTIVVPADDYLLSNGELDLTSSMTLTGDGARTTTITQATTSSTSRVFAILGNPNSGLTPTVTISGVTMSSGRADRTSTPQFDGGDLVNEGTLTLSEDAVEDGKTTLGSGAGISNDGGTLTVTHSLVAFNGDSETNDSGGIQNFGPNPITGGAATLTVIDSTIADNASAQGGGIMSWNDSANSATVTNSTIAGNDGGTRNTTGGGLLAVNGGTISVENSIVADNTVDTPNPGTPSNCGTSGSVPGTVRSLGHNLESGTDCGFTAAGDLQRTDPNFTSRTPQNNGGNTDTLGVDAKSAAVDAIPANASNCAGTDQRDFTRPQGSSCDIGAYEVFQPVEGQSFSAQVALASATISVEPTINWGDGTSSPGTVGRTGGPITGTHAYAEEGIYTGTVSWQDDLGPHTQSFDMKVQDAPLTAAGLSFTTPANVPSTGLVAAFTDADPNATVSDYSATINWGDGTVGPGTVSTNPSGGFEILGTHTYTNGGSYPTTVSIVDAGGANAVASGTATVSAPLLTPPPVITGAPTVGATTAGFSGSVNPGGLPTTAFFQYGLDPKYAGGGPVVYTNSTPAQSVGSDSTSHTVSASVTGLVPNALYHVRLVATNSAGTAIGGDVAFTTLKTPPPGPPVLGKTFNVSLVSGIVLVRLHGQLVPLTELEQIPAGTLIDAIHGTLKLTIALDGGTPARDAAAKGKKPRRKTKTQAGTFGGAIFKVTQARSGLATLSIAEGAFSGAPSYAVCKAHTSADASAAALSSKTLQLLHASAHGKFRTSGRYSAATVQGTVWTIADRCDGTLTHDITDSVLVTDFVHHKTILLHAGQRYLARAPKHR